MSKTTKNRGSNISRATDTLEKYLTPGIRAGATVERAGKLLNAKVPKRTVAMLMSENSPNGFEYTEEMVKGLEQLSKDTKTRVVITAAQAEAIVADRLGTNDNLDGMLPA